MKKSIFALIIDEAQSTQYLHVCGVVPSKLARDHHLASKLQVFPHTISIARILFPIDFSERCTESFLMSGRSPPNTGPKSPYCTSSIRSAWCLRRGCGHRAHSPCPNGSFPSRPRSWRHSGERSGKTFRSVASFWKESLKNRSLRPHNPRKRNRLLCPLTGTDDFDNCSWAP